MCLFKAIFLIVLSGITMILSLKRENYQGKSAIPR